MERIPQPLYDSFTLGSSDVKTSIFQTPIGGAKTFYHTNMTAAGMLPAGQSFLLKGLAFVPLPGQSGALLVAAQKGLFEFYLAATPRFQCPIFYLTSGCGIAGVSNQALATGGADFLQNGVPDPRAVLWFENDQAIPLNSGKNFRVDLTWGTAPTASTFWVFLLGYLDRETQP